MRNKRKKGILLLSKQSCCIQRELSWTVIQTYCKTHFSEMFINKTCWIKKKNDFHFLNLRDEQCICQSCSLREESIRKTIKMCIFSWDNCHHYQTANPLVCSPIADTFLQHDHRMVIFTYSLFLETFSPIFLTNNK